MSTVRRIFTHHMKAAVKIKWSRVSTLSSVTLRTPKCDSINFSNSINRQNINCHTRLMLSANVVHYQEYSTESHADDSQITVTSDSKQDLPLTEASLVMKSASDWKKESYIIEILRNEHYDLRQALVVGITCHKCDAVTPRLASTLCYERGLILVRCKSCHVVHIVCDHLDLPHTDFTSPCNLRSYLLSLDTNTLRLDKDTVEVLPESSGTQAKVKYVNTNSKDSMECLATHFGDATEIVVSAETGVNILKSNESLSLLVNEYEALKEANKRVPEKVSEHHWLALIEKPTFLSRYIYYKYLYRIEGDKRRKKSEKAASATADLDASTTSTDTAEEDAMQENSNTTVIYPTSTSDLTPLQWSHVSAGYQFGPHILYDCGYESSMHYGELDHCVHHVRDMFEWNMRQDEPARLVFTNLSNEGQMYGRLQGIPHISRFADTTSASPNQLYPVDTLVYLSPDATDHPPATYDGWSVYVISNIVDIETDEPLTLDAARRVGARCQALPIAEHTRACRNKWELPITVVHQIILTWINTGSWSNAFQHLQTFMDKPKRNANNLLPPYKILL